jgi:hypothetical protein
MALKRTSGHLTRTPSGHLAKCPSDCCDTYTPVSVAISVGSPCESLFAGTYALSTDGTRCGYIATATPSGTCISGGVTWSVALVTVDLGVNPTGGWGVGVSVQWSPSGVWNYSGGTTTCAGGTVAVFNAQATGGPLNDLSLSLQVSVT